MYVRFTTPGSVTRAGIAPGPFRTACTLAWQHGDEPLGVALWEEIGWFNRCLPVPRGRRPFSVRSKRRWYSDGICWFRAEAREMITHAYVLAALIEECGVPVTRRVAEHPGQILYRDAFQVVAKPEPKRDRRWRRFVSDPEKRRQTCRAKTIPSTRSRPFERTSKRRKGYPSETRVKRGVRTIRGRPDDPNSVELLEKLGRNDPCPCGSGKRFQGVLPEDRPFRRRRATGLPAVRPTRARRRRHFTSGVAGTLVMGVVGSVTGTDDSVGLGSTHSLDGALGSADACACPASDDLLPQAARARSGRTMARRNGTDGMRSLPVDRVQPGEAMPMRQAWQSQVWYG
jgi:hypothetical protein